jgi:hypothetical protein
MTSAFPATETFLSRRLIIALACLISYGATPGHALAQDGNAPPWHKHTTDHFDIHYQSPQRGHLVAVAHEAERAYARISFALSHQLAARMPLILVGADRDLPRSQEEARLLVIASGASEHDHLLLSAETFDKRPAIALAHELTHQFVFELLPRANRDAPWVSEALPDHHGGSWQASELVNVRDALALDSIPRVETLTARDRHWGHAVFDFVAAEYGAQGVRRYLAALREEQTPGRDAIRVAFGVSAGDFNAAFQTYVRAHLVNR